MSKTLTPSVTVRDPKGLKFLEVAGAAYNEACLSEAEAQRVKNQSPGLADLIANHIAEHRHEVPPILKLVASAVKVSGSKRFVVDKALLKEANVGWTGSNFNERFLDKVEENVDDATLAIYELRQSAMDVSIRKELGQEREETMLAHFFDLLKKQSKGQEGQDCHLLVNGYVNVAYIRDKNDVLCAVSAGWYSNYGGWNVGAHSVESPNRWNAGAQILSRDS